MSEEQTRQAIQAALRAFPGQPLAGVAIQLFETLGYVSQRRLALTPNSRDNFLATFAQGRALNETHAQSSEWRSVDFLFQLTDDEIQAAVGQQGLPIDTRSSWNDSIIKSYLFLAVELKGRQYSRTSLAGMTRELNKLFGMPALVLFRHGETLTLAIIHRRPHKRDGDKDVLEKVTVIRDIRCVGTHRAHIEILLDLSLVVLRDRAFPKNFDELHVAWQKVLDTSELNKRFYQELANWYLWALDNVEFPKDAPKDRDNRDSISLIRLITRLIFCWFLREKGLIPEDLFDQAHAGKLLKSLKDNESTYYTAILQNLFFATLNTEMDIPGSPPTRRFIHESKVDHSEDHMVHQFWRYEDRIKDSASFESLMRNVPFLNGGLFECLDERIEMGDSNRESEIRVDGFSIKAKKQPRVPNFLFFGSEQTVDLSKAYGELRYTQTRVRPLMELLERYKFTVAENTPVEEDVALDPELLGHVFENLLASYNPETDTTARKTTGSFYTPRVVVDFMVDEAFVVHFGARLNAAFPESKEGFEQRLRRLFRYSEELHGFNPDEVRVLVESIDQVKILDPACGSGAFPMGALQKLVLILGKLDPQNSAWRRRQEEKAGALDLGRTEALRAVDEAFKRDHGDYARKLYLIENCLYGVDIQPIATQIAKLRCFISLVVEQEPDDTQRNRGILPLPNLETKFIAANTLFGLHRSGQMTLVGKDVDLKLAELRRIRHEHFLARRYSEKKALRKKDKQVRTEFASLLKSNHLLKGPEADLLAGWDPYHADVWARFFDAESMFNLAPKRVPASTTLRGSLGLINESGGQMELSGSRRGSDGFDIVIGNPPYVRQEELKKQTAFEGVKGLERPLKDALKEDYFCYTGVADLFVYFFERSFDLLAVGGVLSFITSNKYFRAGYGERLRHFLCVNGALRLLIDFGDAPVFTAIAYPSIIVARKHNETRDKRVLASLPTDMDAWAELVPDNSSVRTLHWEPGLSVDELPEKFLELGSLVSQREFKPDGWRLESPQKRRIMNRIRAAKTTLRESVNANVLSGLKTGLNDAFIVDRPTYDRIIARDRSMKDILKPILQGRDVKRWTCEPPVRYLIKIESSENVQHPWSGKPPAEAERIFAKTCPEIYERFNDPALRSSLIERYDQGHYFWELRSCAYWAEFNKPKIISTKVSTQPTFAVDLTGCFLLNTTYFVPAHSDASYLSGLLNSTVSESYSRGVFVDKQNGWYEVQPAGLESCPIPDSTRGERAALSSLVDRIVSKRSDNAEAFIGDLEAEADGLAAYIYGLTEEDFRLLLEDLELPDPRRQGAINAYRDATRKFDR